MNTELHETIMQRIVDTFMEEYLSPEEFIEAYNSIFDELQDDYF